MESNCSPSTAQATTNSRPQVPHPRVHSISTNGDLTTVCGGAWNFLGKNLFLIYNLNLPTPASGSCFFLEKQPRRGRRRDGCGGSELRGAHASAGRGCAPASAGPARLGSPTAPAARPDPASTPRRPLADGGSAPGYARARPRQGLRRGTAAPHRPSRIPRDPAAGLRISRSPHTSGRCRPAQNRRRSGVITEPATAHVYRCRGAEPAAGPAGSPDPAPPLPGGDTGTGEGPPRAGGQVRDPRGLPVSVLAARHGTDRNRQGGGTRKNGADADADPDRTGPAPHRQ